MLKEYDELAVEEAKYEKFMVLYSKKGNPPKRSSLDWT